MVKPNALIRPLSNTFKFTATTNRTTGWSYVLPLAEFSYNNTPSATMGVSPFFTNKGYHPNFSVYSNCKLTSSSAKSYVTDLDKLHDFL